MPEKLKNDSERYRTVARICCSAAAAVALMVWLALELGIPRVPSQGHPLILMAPSTVLASLLYAGAAFLIAGQGREHRVARVCLAAMLLCGALVALLSLCFPHGWYSGFQLPAARPPVGVTQTPLDNMSPITAISFLVAGCAFSVLLPAASQGKRRARMSFWVALLFLAGYFMLLLAYLLGTPMFYDGLLFPPSATTCLAFMALWSAFLVLSLPAAWPDALLPDGGTRRSTLALMAGFVLLVPGLLGAGFFYHRNMESERLREVQGRLSAIADLKSGEIAHWREERRIDASFFHQNRAFSAIVESYLRASPRGRGEHALHAWLASVRANRNYDGLYLLDGEGRDRLGYSPDKDPPPGPLIEGAAQALRSANIGFVDLYRDRLNGKISMGVVVPLFDALNQRRKVAVLALRIDPEQYLFPFVRVWPTVSTTAESLLVRREGNHVLFLNDVRFNKESALRLRIPMDRGEVPAVMAVTGRTGLVKGVDYRGEPVLASLRAIPDSPWHLVSRIDSHEVYGPLRERVRITVALIAALLVSAVGVAAFVWKKRNLDFYRQSERDARRHRERLQCLVNVLQYQGDSIESILDYALAEMLGLTGSRYGYIFYYNERKRLFTLCSWSGNVMPDCALVDFQEQCPLENTGIWGEVVRQRTAIVINDFSAPNPLKTGYPEGHVALTRFLTVPVIDQGSIVAVAGVANKETEYDDSDVTQFSLLMDAVWKVAERKRSEDELRQRNAELERFTYTVSHDLKSPVVTISAFLGYLEADMKNGDQERIGKDIGYIRTAADKMGFLLGELLEFLRVGWVISNPVWVDFQDLVQEALQLVAGPISRRRVRVDVPVNRIMLFGDRSRLVEVFQNLVENAVKYMGDQADPFIGIGAEQMAGETVLFVRDNGMGIDQRYRENIFGMFNKLDVASEGSGLGLALVKRIVEMYGGRIWVESEGEGNGSSFRFTLPKALGRSGE
ncbi:GAF domain-containing protein [Pelobacter propionicus]|uniref:histidine kinase n=1 Tax=Pelobacter propionicus (strain DSM 2379 / NBRC 103807 / OttBd1) TaxID=338966 RepID=A1ASK9_PELPD|nr:GAF domain-containing protein [Pelobacter propionicus]ABL00330.1 multi-sensor signal transduction histidine kinase [Pelobacter propionicus DSM 2379]